MTGWQPIETVPAGKPVLVFVPGDEARPVLEAQAYPDGRFYDPTYDEWCGDGATHWMPLPDPPKP